MQFGDLLLVKFRLDPMGYLIRKVLGCNYNHIVWIISDKEMIEVRGRGVMIANPKKYRNNFLYKTKLLRIKDINTKTLYDAIMNYALSLRVKGSYIKLWITYFRVLLDIKMPHPRLTCSGFIALCLFLVGFRFNEYKEPINITPLDIENSKKTYEPEI